MGMMKVCEHCGKRFWASHARTIYCSDECKRIKRNEKALVRNKMVYQQTKSEIKKYRRSMSEVCKESDRPKPAMSILDINTEAHKEGLTYGQYVAKYGIK